MARVTDLCDVPVVTLTTDFGDPSPYVPVLKGVILSACPAARLVDLSHRVPPQDVRHGAYILAAAVPFFPPGTVHLAVVDPGVGGDRRPLLAEAGGQFLVGPDNGLLADAVRALGGAPCVRVLANPAYRRAEVSHTFHGRDVFAPAAAHLAAGADPEGFGPAVADWAELPAASAVVWHDRCGGEVRFVDGFGNLLTNVAADRVRSLPIKGAIVGDRPHHVRWVRTYSDAAPGDLVSLFDSRGFLELAVVNGSAAERLGAAAGTPVELVFE